MNKQIMVHSLGFAVCCSHYKILPYKESTTELWAIFRFVAYKNHVWPAVCFHIVASNDFRCINFVTMFFIFSVVIYDKIRTIIQNLFIL